MEFFDLKKQYQNLKLEIDMAVSRVLEKGVFIGGEEVDGFEKEVARFCGSKFAVALNSGTDALVLSLKALGIKAGDEVIVPAFTYFATADSVAAVGGVPVFADIKKEGFNIDPAKIEKKITSKTKAIIPVHLFGEMADIEAIKTIAQKHNLFVIEDTAQAAGARLGVRRAGAIGDIGCFSLFPTKNLGAYGDGGFVLTDNGDVAQTIRLLRAHGAKPENKYNHLVLGVNSRLDSLQAAIVRVKLRHLDEFNAQRIKNAKYYNEKLKGTGDIVLPKIRDDGSHVFHQYTIRTGRRDALRNHLLKLDVPTMVYFPGPLHLQPAISYLGYKPGDLPQSETAVGVVLSLPIYPELEVSDQDKVITGIKEFFR